MKKSSLKAKSLFGQSKTVRNRRNKLTAVSLHTKQVDKLIKIKKKYGVTVSYIVRTLIDSLE
jgi:hypothetical protein